MNDSAREDYLRAQILTATPQKLQLMLIEAAIRHAQQGRSYLEGGDMDHASGSLVKAQEIVAELIAAVQPTPDVELAKRVKANYLFVHQSLVSAGLQGDAAGIDGALKVLAVERETWDRVCQQSPGATTPIRDLADAPPVGAFASFMA